MVCEQAQWGQRFILSGAGLDAHRLPGELFEDQYNALLAILEPRQTQVGIGPLWRLGLDANARHLHRGCEGGAHKIHIDRVHHNGDAVDDLVYEAVFTLRHLWQRCGGSASIARRGVAGLDGDAYLVQRLWNAQSNYHNHIR